MDGLRIGGRLLSRGMRTANGALTFFGAILVARGIMRWLEPQEGELLYSRTLKPGDELTITLEKPEP